MLEDAPQDPVGAVDAQEVLELVEGDEAAHAGSRSWSFAGRSRRRSRTLSTSIRGFDWSVP